MSRTLTLPAWFDERFGADLYHCASCNYCVDAVWPERGLHHVCATLEHHSPAPGYSGRGFIDTARALLEGVALDADSIAERVFTCTTCGNCETSCPIGLRPAAIGGALREVLTAQEDLLNSVSIENSIDVISAHFQTKEAENFAEAVARIRTDNGLYSVQEGSIEISEQTLFRTSVAMPANLTEGDYSTRVFLTRGGKIISEHETQIDVRKVGLERFLFNLSRQQPLIYGLLSLAIAIIAGWGASAFFRIVRGTA